MVASDKAMSDQSQLEFREQQTTLSELSNLAGGAPAAALPNTASDAPMEMRAQESEVAEISRGLSMNRFRLEEEQKAKLASPAEDYLDPQSQSTRNFSAAMPLGAALADSSQAMRQVSPEAVMPTVPSPAGGSPMSTMDEYSLEYDFDSSSAGAEVAASPLTRGRIARDLKDTNQPVDELADIQREKAQGGVGGVGPATQATNLTRSLKTTFAVSAKNHSAPSQSTWIPRRSPSLVSM